MHPLDNKDNQTKLLSKPLVKEQIWTPSSWKNFPALQQPVYTDENELRACLAQLEKASPLVHLHDIQQLKRHIARAGRGQEFLLQAGDCAERFKDCHSSIIINKINFILQIKNLIKEKIGKTVVPIGRIAGQYAKPRSFETETKNLITLPSFKGDIIHSSEFNYEARKTNPHYMLTAYSKASKTLDYIQTLRPSFYISHEALLLCYESALTRFNNDTYYNSSAHMLWLGERTRNLNGAHVEYLRGIQNPIGIKMSHKITNSELLQLIYILNPNKEEGKIILIPRLGHDNVEEHLSRFIQTIKQAKLPVTWMCDPMHGNSEMTANGIKTRQFDNILAELFYSVEIHKKFGTIFGGVHLETSEEDVTECLGGQQKIQPQDLEKNYQSACDPRLNPQQSLELAILLGAVMQAKNKKQNHEAVIND